VLALVAAGTVAVSGPVSADARPGGKLFAGGFMSQAGSTAANGIAAWDSVNWSALTGPNGEGTDGQVTAMTMYNGKLIVGGSFLEAGGEVVSGIASWDGTTWAPLTGSSGVPGVTVLPLGFVSSLIVYNGDLYVGGMFPRAGATSTVNNLARWNGTEWSAVTGPSGFGTLKGTSDIAPVWDMTIVDGLLVVAGDFTTAGGVAANSIALWDGTTWSSADQPIPNAVTFAVENFNGRLAASRSYADGDVGAVEVIWRDQGVWSTLGGTMDGSIAELTNYDGKLVVCGGFTTVGGVTMNHIAAWNGNSWSALSGPSGNGTNGDVFAVTLHFGLLVAGGRFSDAGGQSASNLALWNGSAWSALPGGGTNDLGVFSLLST
jgi:hypothetical protein